MLQGRDPLDGKCFQVLGVLYNQSLSVLDKRS